VGLEIAVCHGAVGAGGGHGCFGPSRDIVSVFPNLVVFGKSRANFQCCSMSFLHPKKEVGRDCLHPEVGGQERRRKIIEMFAWGILVGAIASLLLAIGLYVIIHRR